MSKTSYQAQESRKRILLVEDNAAIAKSVTLALGPEGFDVTVAEDIESARRAWAPETFAAILLDLMLPDGNGMDFGAELRLKDPNVPVLILTAKIDEDSAVEGLAVANDYIRKPFGKRELLARLQRCLKEKVTTGKTVAFEGLKIDLDRREATVEGQPLTLRPKEFLVLSVLVTKADEVVSRESILRLIDSEGEMFDRSLDSHISRIRSALKRLDRASIEIAAVPGEGYRLKRRA